MRPVVVLLPPARDDRDAAMRVLASAAGPVSADHPAGQCYVMAMADGDPTTGTTAADVATARVLDRARPDGMPSAFPPAPPTEAESRVLRYLPTNLSAPEIAAELFCSVDTVKTRIRHVYAKLRAKAGLRLSNEPRALDMLASTRGQALPPAITFSRRYRTDNYPNG